MEAATVVSMTDSIVVPTITSADTILLKPIAQGTATVILEDDEGRQATIEVNVNAQLNLTNTVTAYKLDNPITIQNTFNFTPNDFSVTTVDVATFDVATLTITALKPGTTNIVVADHDGREAIIPVVVLKNGKFDFDSAKITPFNITADTSILNSKAVDGIGFEGTDSTTSDVVVVSFANGKVVITPIKPTTQAVDFMITDNYGREATVTVGIDKTGKVTANVSERYEPTPAEITHSNIYLETASTTVTYGAAKIIVELSTDKKTLTVTPHVVNEETTITLEDQYGRQVVIEIAIDEYDHNTEISRKEFKESEDRSIHNGSSSIDRKVGFKGMYINGHLSQDDIGVAIVGIDHATNEIVIKAKQPGKARFTVTDGENREIIFEVTVNSFGEISLENQSIYTTDGTFNFSNTTNSLNIEGKYVSSSNGNIASVESVLEDGEVSEFIVHAVKPGKVTISIWDNQGKTSEIYLEVLKTGKIKELD